jgi:hypothetical protein
MVGGRVMGDLISTLVQCLQTSFWTIQLVVNGYAVVKFAAWLGDDTPDEPRLQCELCGSEATVSGDGEPDTVSCRGPPGDRHEETEMTEPR